MHDLVIRNALLLDGLGSAPAIGDLAVADGKISGIGKDLGSSKQTIDADGLALMPGIIDNHTHYDAQLTWDPLATPSPALGVTTAIIGNCGFTIAPCRPADRELILRNLTQVEGMALEVLQAGTRWDFESVPEFFAMLERGGVALNIAGFVGHSSVRTYVMGADAPRRAATAAEVAKMKDIVLEGVRAGAVGFATSTSGNHNGHGGIPMPSRLADDAELRALVGLLREQGFRDAVRAEIAGPAGVRIFNGEWDKVYVQYTKLPQHKPYEQQTVAELARARGADPLDTMLDLAIAEDLDTEFSALLLNSDEKAVGEMLRHPGSLVSLSDAGAHLTLFNDAGFGLHLMGHWSRELGVLKIEEAVQKITSHPASVFGIPGRGVLKAGNHADLLLFDPATVDRGPKKRVQDLPGGGARLITPPVD